MSQQNLNKIYSQVRPVETLVSSSVENTIIQVGSEEGEVYLLNKYDSGKTLHLDNDNTDPNEPFIVVLPRVASDDMLGWNIRATTKTANWYMIMAAARVGETVEFTGSVIAGGSGWNADRVTEDMAIMAGSSGSTVDITCVEADSENLKFVFTTKS